MKLTLALLAMTLADSTAFSPDEIQTALSEAYQKYIADTSGKEADYIPELAKVDPNLFGISIVTADGEIFSIGDATTPFAIESISKPFTYALALQERGGEFLAKTVGLNATGFSFNSVLALELKPDHLQNPLVNAGAIQVTSLIPGGSSQEKWDKVFSFIRAFSDGEPTVSQSVYQSESTTDFHNRGIAELMTAYGMIEGDPLDAVDRYTRACSIQITAEQLALMGATLANYGVNPQSGQMLLSPEHTRDVLSTMVTNGLYEGSGAWFWRVGLPTKSGVGGGMVAVVPGRMAIAVYSPRLDPVGNSVRGQEVIQFLSDRWRLHLLSPER